MIHFTLFRNRSSLSKSDQAMSWSDFVNDFRHHAPEFKDKHSCPLISLTRYGDSTSFLGSYRHVENALSVHGIEGDYDGGEVSPTAGYRRLLSLRLRAAIITTPSHAPAFPRWRILMPLARPCDISERRGLVERLNGALHGILAPESATATQCFYIGKVAATAAHYSVHESFGRCIDEASDITALPLAVSAKLQGARTASRAEWSALSREGQYAAVQEAFAQRDGRHEAARRLATMMAQDGADAETIRDELIRLLGPNLRGGERGERDLARDIRSLPEWAVQKIGIPKYDLLARANRSAERMRAHKLKQDQGNETK